MRTVLQDLRYALRMLRKNPGFTAVGIITLALGIGANTAIFTLVNTVLLRPLPYPEPDRIVQFIFSSPPGNNNASVPEFMMWREQTQAFQDVAAYGFQGPGVNLTGGDRPEQLQGIHVSADYFRLLGAPLEVGRTFSENEDALGGPRLVVISNGLWQRRFGGDRSLVGKAILLEGQPHVVIGVLGANFTAANGYPADIWLPLQADPSSTDHNHYLRALARLRPRVTLEMAKAQMKVASEQYRKKFPGTTLFPGSPVSFTVEPLRDVVVGDVRLALVVLLGAVSFILLIACANVANLLLARATGRRREMALRVALGAGRRRIISQLLTESVLLSFAGGALGIVLGYAGMRALLAISPGDIPRIGEQGSALTLDGRVLVFTLVVSVLAAILFGLLPAISASRAGLSMALNESGVRSGAGWRQSKARSLLVVTEMALALVLLAGAALLIRTFMALQSVDPGFDAHNVLTLEMSLGGKRFEKTAAVAQLLSEAGRRVESIPGVTALATTSSLPLEPAFDQPFTIEGRPLTKDAYHGDAEYREVSPRYFEVFRIPLRHGRTFTKQDNGRTSGVLLINEAMARQFWAKGDPVGERITIGKGISPDFEEPARQIIGVVADVRDTGLDRNPEPIMYVPVAQLTDGVTALTNRVIPITWVIRTRVESYSLSADIERELRLASGGLPAAHIRSMEQVRVESTAGTNFNMMLLSIFAGLAMLLAAIGIYGVISYAVGQRVHEIGIRMALGARAADVLSLVLRQGLSLAAVGIAIGLFGAMWLTQALKSLLFRVSPTDPLTFAIAGVLLLTVAAAACYIPARRATKVDPIVALRYE